MRATPIKLHWRRRVRQVGHFWSPHRRQFAPVHNCGRSGWGNLYKGRTAVDSCAWWPQTIRESYNLCSSTSSTSLDNHFTLGIEGGGGLTAMSMTNFCSGLCSPLLKFPFFAKIPEWSTPPEFPDGSAVYSLTHSPRWQRRRQLVNKIVNCHFVLLSSSRSLVVVRSTDSFYFYWARFVGPKELWVPCRMQKLSWLPRHVVNEP